MQTIYFFTAWGRAAVIGFFVLSGYLIARGYAADLVAGRIGFCAFLRRRFIRLYVVLVPALALTWAIAAAREARIDADPVTLLSNLVFLQPRRAANFGGNEALWSLGYEAWCYVLFACAMRALGHFREGKLGYLFVYVATSVALVAAIDVSLAYYFALWLTGALAAWFERKWTSSQQKNGIPGLFAFAVVLFLSSAIAFRTGLPGEIRDVIIALPLSLVLATFRSKKHSVKVAWGRVLAGISYSLYLIHYPLLEFMHESFASELSRPTPLAIVVFICECALCLVLAWFLATLTERHTSKVRSWIERLVSQVPQKVT